MTPDLSEILRTLANLIRIGHIADVNGDKARVQLSPTLKTTWLKWSAFRAGNVVSWCPPSPGEQVIVFSPDGDLTRGRILAGLYSEDSPAPEQSYSVNAIHYPDGAVVRYDFESHALTATLPAGSSALVKADEVTADTPITTCTGDVKIKGNLTVEGVSALNNGMTVKGGEGGAAAVINGAVKATGDVVAGDISLQKHRTSGVQRGNDESGWPIA
ncbi:phage baseplate assembly protein V [Herbaspirillum robiniae]|uniref:phage baseplate assembly protein V n=1 Tax=Herbaspirillum robiniae TaxID=2014887 RepID=UPI0009A146BF|nr:phage baseplate assembly protein V [Herbaspirillum robiniae]